ncbi:MAG: recombinase family protein [Candidatus Caenarcaniphilales bacterium]|nr:recombinase family protein [Candidatus Caenarcaniphilales bacterium]
MSNKYASYIRVSTDKQGDSKLGIEAQQRINSNYIKNVNGELIKEAIEIETGTNKTRISIKQSLNLDSLLKKRPILKELIEYCQKEKVTLVIKDLSRLGRNQLLISFLMQAGINFICADAPSDSPFILQIKAAVYEEEARLISKRTIEALQSKKARGEKLGNEKSLKEHRWKQAQYKIEEAKQYYSSLEKRLSRMKTEGKTYKRISEELNHDGIRTRTGKEFKPMTVKRIMERVKTLPEKSFNNAS